MCWVDCIGASSSWCKENKQCFSKFTMENLFKFHLWIKNYCVKYLQIFTVTLNDISTKILIWYVQQCITNFQILSKSESKFSATKMSIRKFWYEYLESLTYKWKWCMIFGTFAWFWFLWKLNISVVWKKKLNLFYFFPQHNAKQNKGLYRMKYLPS